MEKQGGKIEIDLLRTLAMGSNVSRIFKHLHSMLMLNSEY